VTKRILVTNWIDDASRDFLARHGDVECPDTRAVPDPAWVKARAAQADAMMAFMPDAVDEAFLAGAPHLRIVACALKGFDNFDVAACSRAGVWVSIVPDLLTAPTAELALGLAIALGRHISAGDAFVRSGQFAGWRPALYGTGLDGAAVGILGHGKVGRAIEARLAGFGCDIAIHDPAHADSTPLDALLARADYLFVAVPLVPGARHLLDAQALARLKPGALLVNVGRGSTLSEAAVADALVQGRLGGYAADVFEMEDWALPDRPHAIDPRLLAHPRTLFTPHLGSAVARVRADIAMAAARNIADFLEGKRPRDAINEPHAAPSAAR
jgi:phosphonate dehydrogenase